MNDRSILARQVDLLYRNVLLGQTISVLNGAMLAWLWHQAVGSLSALAWWLLAFSVAAARTVLARKYEFADYKSREDAEGWLRAALFGAGTAGAVWASGALLFMLGADDRRLFFTAFVMGGMVAGAVPVLSAHRAAFRLYSWPIVLATAIAGVCAGTDPLHVGFVVMVGIFVLGVTRSADYFHETLLETLRLEHEKGNLLADLTVAKVRAESSAAAKARFLANVSHELRTPMNGIMGMATLLAMEDPTPAQRNLLEPLTRSANELLRKIDDMIELSDLEAGRIAIYPMPFSVSEILAGIVGKYQEAAQAKGLELRLGREQDLPEVVVGDIDKVRKILEHVVDNAIKFTEAGHVDFEARLVSLGNAETGIAFIVSDTGPGMQKAELDRVFEVFNPGDDSKTKRHYGTGVGLPIAHRLADALGGSLRISSTPHIGTVVTLELPLRGPLPPTGPSQDSSDPADPGRP